jgi:hypothetical protein
MRRIKVTGMKDGQGGYHYVQMERVANACIESELVVGDLEVT